MGRISFANLPSIERLEKQQAVSCNAGCKKVYSTKSTMYRLEFPDMTYEQAVAMFNRLDMFMRRNVKSEQTLVVMGLSRHKHWTPYAEVTSEKGGRPKKTFNAMPCYQAKPHIHLSVLGKGARSISERVYKNQSRRMKLKPIKDALRSQHKFCPLYIKWQSDLYREYGGRVADFITDDDALSFSTG